MVRLLNTLLAAVRLLLARLVYPVTLLIGPADPADEALWRTKREMMR